MTEQRDAFLAAEADAWFDRNPAGKPLPSWRDKRLAAYVRPASSVLEVGCADGRKLAELSDVVSGRLAGVDPSGVAIEDGRQRWPQLDLRVGSADALPFDEQFGVVILGFFLYLCDRVLLPQIVSECDRVLQDRGMLAIIDFDPRYPRRRPYRHRKGLWTYKMDYASLFLAFPSYSLVERVPFHHAGDTWVADETERIALTILHKDLGGGYSDEPDG